MGGQHGPGSESKAMGEPRGRGRAQSNITWGAKWKKQQGLGEYHVFGNEKKQKRELGGDAWPRASKPRGRWGGGTWGVKLEQQDWLGDSNDFESKMKQKRKLEEQHGPGSESEAMGGPRGEGRVWWGKTAWGVNSKQRDGLWE